MKSAKLRERRRSALVVLILGTLLIPGCVRRGASGVGIKSLTADLVFGVPPLPESAPPPSTDLGPTDQSPIVPVPGALRPRPGAPTFEPLPECAVAGPNDFPDREAPTAVEGQTKTGAYLWKVKGSDVAQGRALQLPDESERAVIDSRANFFTTEEEELKSGSERKFRHTYRVDADGVKLVTRTIKVQGKPDRTFAPFPELLVLPLPVRLGLSADSTATDPNSQEALRQTGSVVRRQRVDACGKVLDSWWVETTQTFTSVTGESFSRRYNYGVATHFGGLIIGEHVESPVTNPTLIFDANIGQVDPSPLE